MVMQRIANPPIPVRFWVSPPNTRPGGEIGRHNGLKIRRLGKTSVPVRFRFRAPVKGLRGFRLFDVGVIEYSCKHCVSSRARFCCCLPPSLLLGTVSLPLVWCSDKGVNREARVRPPEGAKVSSRQLLNIDAMPLRHCPSRIYKYFGPQEECIDSLMQGLLRHTPLGAFNDPFEGRPKITGLTNDAEMTKQVGQVLAGQEVDESFEKIFQQISAEQYEDIAEEDKRGVSLEEFRVRLRAILKENEGGVISNIMTNFPVMMNCLSQRIDAHIGACSFSEVPDNLLMWAHYGAWHKGFVVEFDAHHPYFHERKSPEDELRHLRRVLYRSSRKSALLSELSGTEMFLVKSEHWAYEREWRILRAFEDAAKVIPRPDYPIHLFAFPYEAVTSVILGARIQPDTEERVRRFLATVSVDGNVRLKRVIPDESHFVLRIEETAI